MHEVDDGKHKRKADLLRHLYGEHYIVHLSFGHGRSLYPRFVGQGSGQCGNLQNDQSSIQHTDRRHDRISKWNKT
jgi:hypothetical protein